MKNRRSQEGKRKRAFHDPANIGEYVPAPFEMNDSLRKQIRALREKKQTLTVGYGRSALSFDVKKQTKKALRGGVRIEISRLNMIKGNRNISADTPLNDVMTSFDMIFDKIVEQALKASNNDQDKLQIVVRTEHEKIDASDTGMKHPIRSEMIDVGNWRENENEKSRVLSKLFSKIEPYDNITLGDNIIVETILIKNRSTDATDDVEASGLKRKILREKSEFGSCVVRMANSDNMCLARAVVVALAHHEYMVASPSEKDGKLAAFSNMKRFRGKRSNQTTQAESLLIANDIDPRLPTTNKDIEPISKSLGFNIKVIDSDNVNFICKYGDPSYKHSLYLLREKIYFCNDTKDPMYHKKFKYHFDAIVDMARFRQTTYFCHYCDVGFKYRTGHRCQDIVDSGNWCYSCYDRDCFQTFQQEVVCDRCNAECRNDLCLRKHIETNFICDRVMCFKCRTILTKKIGGDGKFESKAEALKSHECKVICRNCSREKNKSGIHKCYMTRQPLKSRCEKILFLDFETDQSSGVHIPIYCCMQWVEFSWDEKTGIETEKETGEKEIGLSYSTFSDVGDFLFSEISPGKSLFQNYTIIGHNMKGFDGCFLLRYLIEKNIETKIIANGLKLTSVLIPKYRQEG
jgi:hypothetical protein